MKNMLILYLKMLEIHLNKNTKIGGIEGIEYPGGVITLAA